MMSTPLSASATLYHGSRYLHTVLMPAFQHTHKLVRWDQTEDNTWLYATTDRDEAIRQAIYGWIGERFTVDGFHGDDKRIRVELAPTQDTEPGKDLVHWLSSRATPEQKQALVEKSLKTARVYLYTIYPQDSFADAWVKNSNPHNQLTTEWKTRRQILVARPPTHYNVLRYLKEHHLELTFELKDKTPLFLRW